MKARVIVVELDDVTPSDVSEALSRFFPAPQQPPQVETVSTPALPPPTVAEPPRTRLAKTTPGWRPGRGTRNEDPSPKSLRPKTAEKFMCGACGEDRPEGKDGRARCGKCNARAWEKCPAQGEPAAALDFDDE